LAHAEDNETHARMFFNNLRKKSWKNQLSYVKIINSLLVRHRLDLAIGLG